MRKMRVAVLVFTSFFASQIQAQSTELDLDDIAKQVLAAYKITVSEISSENTNLVFKGRVIKADVMFLEQGLSEPPILVVDGEIIRVENLFQTMELPVLTSMIKDDFRLNNETDAKTFEAALDVLYAADRFDKRKHDIIKRENDWVFVRGTFFESLKVLIVTTDENGKIDRMRYDLEFAEKDLE